MKRFSPTTIGIAIFALGFAVVWAISRFVLPQPPLGGVSELFLVGVVLVGAAAVVSGLNDAIQLAERVKRFHSEGGRPPQDAGPPATPTTNVSGGSIEKLVNIARADVVNIGGPEAAVPRPPVQKPPRSEHFTGRGDELKQLVAELQPGCRITICGPGGIGKSALVAEAIWRLAPDDRPPVRFPDGILFHTFYHQPAVDLALEAFTRAIGKEVKPNPAEAARRALAGQRVLLVLDGTEAVDNRDAVLAVAGGCGVLITTRRHRDAPANWVDLGPLEPDEAVRLLRAWGGDCAADGAAAGRIATLVGAVPLALFLVGRYLSQRRQRAADYVSWLESTPWPPCTLARGRAAASGC